MTESADFRPDWVSAPGETIRDILAQRNMSAKDLARKIGTSERKVFDLLQGQKYLTQEIAVKLQTALGGSARFWKRREKRYRDGLRHLQNLSEEKTAREWLSELPVAEMIRLGWLRDSKTIGERMAACLQFFGVNAVTAWRKQYDTLVSSAVFRTSPTFESKPGAVAAWLRQGEIESSRIACRPWDAKKFMEALKEARALTRESNADVFIPELGRRFADCGVAVAVLRAPSGCRASGATRFIASSKALMLLSFRYLSDDQFWFSVFHEAGHLLLHPHKLFLDAPGMPSSKEEEEANQFAADVLVPHEYNSEMLQLPVNGRAVMRFARKIDIAPGIVVGQLQHLRRFERRQLNNLKRRYKWNEQ
jgi:plasmid maintenance system antidote protein VapI